MTRKTYEHSAYWYAYHYGWTYSEAKTYTGKYLDIHTYRPRMRIPISIAMQTPRRRGLKVESRYVLAFRRSNQASPYDSPSATSLMRGRNVCMSRYFPVCVFASLYVQP